MSVRPPPYQKPVRKFLSISDLVANPVTGMQTRKAVKFCLCYACGEIFINDTIINTLLCPGCPSQMTMMNFDRFKDALDESKRVAEINSKKPAPNG